jgi:hypothetical protein
MPEDCNGRHLKLWTPATYRIEVVGALDESWSDRLGGMIIKTRQRADQSTVTTLTGRMIDQPVFDVSEGDFDSANPNLTDITFDLVYAGTNMTSKQDGYLWGLGAAGTLPTATNGDLGGNQWRLGPKGFGGIIRKWGLVGALVSHQWNVGGSNDTYYSTTSSQYFYAIGLGGGWQIASSPVISYDWQADSDDAWAVPVGFGVAKTTKIGKMPWKFQFQVQKYVVTPDTFGPDWLVKFTITPVIKNPFAF